MSAVSLGDLARTFLLRRQNAALKADVQLLSTEVVTGLAADVRQKTGGDLSALQAIDGSLTVLAARASATGEAASIASALQTGLARLDGLASDMSMKLLSVGNNATAMTTDQLGEEAEEAFRTAVATLNTRVGDRSIFAGTRPQQAAVLDADTILTALDTVIAGATTAADVQTAIEAWFDDPSGYSALAYTGGGRPASVTIATGETVALEVTADSSAIRDSLKGLALAAMLNRGALSGALSERVSLGERAGSALLQGQTARVDLGARLGRAEARIHSATISNAAEVTSLQMARKELLGTDEYETATLLKATQAQLETLYNLTVRLSQMSLTDYL
ncbi:flagellar biosynthesis protein FlgL [Cereibacter sphaeroides]|uniref:flagellin n=1 Tax=Cereibacter sphaeroides TaxID=1063 RepID=UPI000F522B02|nr:flagellin [Cereibacter sphaeroides]AZB53875.1 flagellar biosynthesis protein FlgL [Cereibacter sphaeroides]AZB58135.1 flagellar biosynthesis protein FlgL [Cereibacter sphaeroides]MWP37212.1 flagellar biosynthesis protein FlgL [Cereibacter sphaeroides]